MTRGREKTADAALCFQARPLTRYLPIRKEDFDLKTHIESSGHGVDTCLHVVLSSKVCGLWGPGVLGRGPRSLGTSWALGIVAPVPALTLEVSVPGRACWPEAVGAAAPQNPGTGDGFYGAVLGGEGPGAPLWVLLHPLLLGRSAAATWSRWAARLNRGRSAGLSSTGSSAPFPITWVSSRQMSRSPDPWALGWPPGQLVFTRLPSGGLGGSEREPDLPLLTAHGLYLVPLQSWSFMYLATSPSTE